jgi:cyclopropane-fatty-acyl-phospholipid synthase
VAFDPGPADAVARRIVHAAARLVAGGALTIVDDQQPRGVTRGTGRPDRYDRPPLQATIQVHRDRAYRRILTGGSVGLGESYADGDWDADDLTAALRILSRTMEVVEPARGRLHRWGAPLSEPVRRLRRQDRHRDREDIRAHYDIGNDFYERLLDETMMYSSAVFADAATPLHEASTHKLDRLCEAIGLGPDDHVLEIGTGWGGFAVHAARTTGARVTTTTISDEQYRYACDRVRAEGLEGQVTVLDRDYRELEGRYDAIVSIEMIEAVDWREYPTFFSACDQLLAPHGRMAMQAIVIPGQRYERAKVRRDFIKQVMFPGGCLPSVNALVDAAETTSDLGLVGLTDIGLHYAETLRRWQARLEAARPDLGQLGLDERFARLWRFYLAYCEAGFDERAISATQLTWARPGWRP